MEEQYLEYRDIPSSGESMRAVHVVAYLLIYLAILWMADYFFEYLPYLDIGPVHMLVDAPCALAWRIFLIVVVGAVGLYGCARSLVGGFADSIFYAATSTGAVVGLYLMPYTLENRMLAALVALGFAGAIAFGVLRARSLVYGRPSVWDVLRETVLPMWGVSVVLGVATVVLWQWVANPVFIDVEYPPSPEDRSLSAHMDALDAVMDPGWDFAGLREKAQVLAEFAVVESWHLRVEDVPDVRVGAEPRGVVSSYDPEENLITLDPGYLRIGGKVEAINSIAHECYHAFQHQCSRRLEAGTLASSAWGGKHPSEDTVQTWAREFAQYVDGKESIEEYADQHVESSARLYAIGAYLEYEERYEGVEAQ